MRARPLGHSWLFGNSASIAALQLDRLLQILGARRLWRSLVLRGEDAEVIKPHRQGAVGPASSSVRIDLPTCWWD